MAGRARHVDPRAWRVALGRSRDMLLQASIHDRGLNGYAIRCDCDFDYPCAVDGCG